MTNNNDTTFNAESNDSILTARFIFDAFDRELELLSHQRQEHINSRAIYLRRPGGDAEYEEELDYLDGKIRALYHAIRIVKESYLRQVAKESGRGERYVNRTILGGS